MCAVLKWSYVFERMRHFKQHLLISPWNSILIKLTSVYFLYLYWVIVRYKAGTWISNNSTTWKHWDNFRHGKHMREGFSFPWWIYDKAHQVFFLNNQWEKWLWPRNHANCRRNFQKLTQVKIYNCWFPLTWGLVCDSKNFCFVNWNVNGADASKPRICDTLLDVSLSSHTWKKRYAPFDWLLGS